MEFYGVNEMRQCAVRVGEDIDVQVVLPYDIVVGGTYTGKTINGIELKIDPFTPLPEELTFADGHITGKLDRTYNKFVHVLVELTLDGSSAVTTTGGSFELIVLANSPAVDPAKPNKGCGGDIAALSSLILVLAAAGTGLLISRKRKED